MRKRERKRARERVQEIVGSNPVSGAKSVFNTVYLQDDSINPGYSYDLWLSEENVKEWLRKGFFHFYWFFRCHVV